MELYSKNRIENLKKMGWVESVGGEFVLTKKATDFIASKNRVYTNEDMEHCCELEEVVRGK